MIFFISMWCAYVLHSLQRQWNAQTSLTKILKKYFDFINTLWLLNFAVRRLMAYNLR